MEADACSAGYLLEDGQGALETRGLRDLNFVDQGGNEIVGVFEGVADIMQTLNKEAGTLIDIMRGAIELAVYGSAIRYFANELIIHIYFFFL